MNKSPFAIRVATDDDLPEMIQLYFQSEEFHRTQRPDLFRKPSTAEIQKLFESFMKDPLVTSLVATIADKPVAFVRFCIYEVQEISYLVDLGRYHAFIDELVVSTEQRRLGIGQALMAETERLLLRQGIRHIQLNVTNFNLPARALYQSIGYQPIFCRLGKTLT